jgi:hypothetical protein
MYTFHGIVVIVTQWLEQYLFFTSWEFDFQQFQQNINKTFFLFFTRPFVNYFVTNSCCRYSKAKLLYFGFTD